MGNPTLKDAVRSIKPDTEDRILGSVPANTHRHLREELLNNLRNLLFQTITRMDVDYSDENDEEWLIERAGHFLEMYRTNGRNTSPSPNLTKIICQMPFNRCTTTTEDLFNSIPDSELSPATTFIEKNVAGTLSPNTSTNTSYQIKLHAGYRNLYSLVDIRVAYRCLYKQNRRDGNTPAFRRGRHMPLEGSIIDHCGILEALRNLVQCYDMALELRRSLPDLEALDREPELRPSDQHTTKAELLNDSRSCLKDFAMTLNSRGRGAVVPEDMANIEHWDELRCLETARTILSTLRQELTENEGKKC